MKYQQPYGISDPDAPYINGNPSTGTMGSIPPAASIEHPQREIVNFITKSNLVPNAADLLQLGKSIQSGLVNWGIDAGLVNRIDIVPVIPVAAYTVGIHFIIRVAYNNTSSVQVRVSGLPWMELTHCDLTPILGGELRVNQLITVAYDGTRFQLLSGGAPGSAIVMTGVRDVYVNDGIGSDSFDGASPSISGTNTGPFKTIQKALSTMTKYNLGGWTFNIHVADGTYYTTSAIMLPVPNGSGMVAIIGNNTNPAACQIYNNGTGSCFFSLGGGQFSIGGFAYRTIASTLGDPGCGIYFAHGGMYWGGTASWGPVAGHHILIGPAASSLIGGTQYITGGAPNGGHIVASLNGVALMDVGGPGIAHDLTILNPVTFLWFAFADAGSQVRPIYKTITGAANVTAQKYRASANGVIYVGGNPVTYLPGNTAGVIATGGQYV